MDHPVTKFRPVLLPPADVLLQGAREDLTHATASLHLGTVDTGAVGDAAAHFTAVGSPIRARLERWASTAFAALEQAIALDGAGASNVLYIVTTPEFALNGRTVTPGGSDIAWDATGLLPNSVRLFVRQLLIGKLATLPPTIRVVFTFSCAVYDDTNLIALGNNVGMTNMITIISHPPAIAGGADLDRYVRKRAPNRSADNMPASWVFSKTWLDTAADDEERLHEVVWTSPFFTAEGKQLTLGFATCEDVLKDSHPDVNFVIVVGSGAPFFRTPLDATGRLTEFLLKQPFVLNDKLSWANGPLVFPAGEQPIVNGAPSMLSAAGYYQIFTSLRAPSNSHSVYDFILRIPSLAKDPPKGIPDTRAPEMKSRYLYPAQRRVNMVGDLPYYTKIDVTVALAPAAVPFITTEGPPPNIPARGATSCSVM